MAMVICAQVLARVRDGIGELTLNRPRALNSLNSEMVKLLGQHYSAWSTPGSGVRAVLLMGAGDKASKQAHTHSHTPPSVLCDVGVCRQRPPISLPIACRARLCMMYARD